MPNQDAIWTLQKYLLYDFAHDRLANRRLFACYDTAAQAANGQATVMIVPLALKGDSRWRNLSRVTARG